MNNIVANFGTGIDASGGSTIIGSTLYQNNGTNSDVGLGTFPIVLAANAPLFVDAASGNYYPAPGSQAIDSSLQRLDDNPEFNALRHHWAEACLRWLAPELDIFGQVRGDDEDVDTPSAQGGNVTLDRGAIDRVDFFQPIAVLSNPEDNSVQDLDPTVGIVFATIPDDLREFRVRLDDQGIGIDDSRINTNQFTLQQDGVDLIDGVHYVWSYNSVTNEVLFTAVTTFPLERRYTVVVENQPFNPTQAGSIDGVRDLAGNFLEANQTDGSTTFQILLTDNVNDPPINGVPSSRQRIDEDTDLTFSVANGNAITVSDADVHLSSDPSLNVTITSTFGLLSLSGTQGLTFLTGNTGVDEASITFRGTVTDINAALDGLTFTPLADYSNLLSGDAASLNPAEVTITTDDGSLDAIPVGQFSRLDSPVETDTDTIEIDVVSVNDPPSFDTPVSDPAAIDEDSPAVSLPGFVTGMTAGPQPSEAGQTFAFDVQPPNVISGNLVFTSAPAISPTGELTYSVAGDTNGVAQFAFTLVDANAGDPNHVPASSQPVNVTITVNAINDKPELSLLTNTVTGVEDEGARTGILLVDTATAGPATATDELAVPPAGQALTYMSSAPTVTGGNLAFTSFAVSPVDGSLSFEAAPNTAGTATFNIWVQDDGSTTNVLDDNTSVMIPVTITVAADGDPPVPVTPNYVLDEGDALTLDASGSTDPDIGFPGDTLTYSWDLDGDGTFDRIDETNSVISIPWSELSQLPNLNVPGDNSITLRVTDTFDGTSVDTTATLAIITADYGDAPNTYGTLRASNGAAHTIVDGFFLGASVDSEADGQPVDLDGADEDGIVFEAGMQADGSIDIESFFTATASAAGKLDIWLDFNADGVFDTSEHLNNGISYDLIAGANTFDFTIGAGQAMTGVDTWARARFSSAGSLAPTGRANDGEVEDQMVQFSPLLDAVSVVHVLPMWDQTSDTTPILRWRQADNTPPGSNALYNVELRNSLNQVVGFQENHVGETLTISDPLPPGIYTAFITSINRAGVALLPATPLDSFEVVAMTVTSPAGLIQDNTPTISWTSVDQTDHYELQIRSAITGQLLREELNLPGTQATFDVVTALDLGSYQVRVRAVEAVTGQVGEWSPFQTFQVATSPTLVSPTTGQTVSTGSPQITWTAIPGAVSYDIRLNDVTDDIAPFRNLTGLTGTSAVLTEPLDLGEYSVEIRGVNADGLAGEWSPVSNFTVGRTTTVSQPVGSVEDATPTIAWAAVPGAEVYDLRIIPIVGGVEGVPYAANGLTTTEHTVPDDEALALGQYRLEITGRNLAAATSSGQSVEATSQSPLFFVTFPPEILTPAVGIYDTTPEVTWTLPLGAATSELVITNALTGAEVYSQTGITGDSFTVDTPLPAGLYEAKVRSLTDAAPSAAPIVESALSTGHVFQIGSPPIPQGLSQGLGGAPYFETVDKRPTLTWEQSLAGETFEVWLTDVSNQEIITIEGGLEETSYTVAQDLPVGRYRYWVRADNGLGEKSDWSSEFVFDVRTRPVIATVSPSFSSRPTFTWNTSATGNLQQELDRYRVFIRQTNVTPFVDVIDDAAFSVMSNQYTPDFDLEPGRYTIWVRGINDATPVHVSVQTIWSIGVDFELGGRTTVTVPETTDDSTPSISWQPVGEASSYELYVAPAATPGSPLVNVSGLTATSFQLTDPLPNGDYVAWVRATSTSGEVAPWSFREPGQFSVTGSSAGGLGQVVVSPVPASNDSTPTFTWTPDPEAARYDIWVSTQADSSIALIRDVNISGTTFTSTRTLAPGDYRVWVRAISSTDVEGPWSVPVAFTILASNEDAAGSPDDIVMLASMNAVSASLQADDVTVSLIPAVVVEDSGRQVSGTQTNVADEVTVQQSNVVKPAGATMTQPVVAQILDAKLPTEADDVMSNWDDAIWAEESGSEVDVAVVDQPVTTEKTESRGWLAGLALFSSSMFGRRRKTDDE